MGFPNRSSNRTRRRPEYLRGEKTDPVQFERSFRKRLLRDEFGHF